MDGGMMASQPDRAAIAEKYKFRISDEQHDELIRKYTRDLTQRVIDGRTMPVIGREDEVDRVLTILLQMGRSNACLIGSAGVGKTALFTAVARELHYNADKMPKLLRGARVIEVEMSRIGAGAQDRSEYEGRLVPILDGAAERNATRELPLIIFCFDEIHTISGRSHATSASGIAELFKPYLTTGDLQFIGATTRDEYTQYIVPDPALDRRFQKIELKESTHEETIIILKGLRENYERFFGLSIPEERLIRCCDLTAQFMRNRRNPDKSLIILDGACARALRKGFDTLDDDSVRESLADEINVTVRAIE